MSETVAEVPKETQDPKLDEIPKTFPQRLMEVLSNEELSDVISWLPHGKGFVICKKKKFADEVLPRYFKQCKFTSFTRKLNRWGFNRVTRGPETGAYYHNLFQKGEPRLCFQMDCKESRSQKDESANVEQQLMNLGMGIQPFGFSSPASMFEPAMMIQRQLQIQQLQNEQQIQAAFLQTLMAAHIPSAAQQAVLGSANGKDENALIWTQGRDFGLSSQPLMKDIQSSLLLSQSSSQGSSVALPEPERSVKRASAA